MRLIKLDSNTIKAKKKTVIYYSKKTKFINLKTFTTTFCVRDSNARVTILLAWTSVGAGEEL